MNILSFSLILIILLVLVMTLVRYGFEKAIARLLKSVKIEQTGVQLFTRAILLILFNLGVLALFGLLKTDLFLFKKFETGWILLVVGLGLGLLVALLSFLAIKAGYGGGYQSLASPSALEKGFSLATFLLLAGPSEDIFFIGFVQNALTPSLGWGAILVYLVLFIAYHYANVLSGVEKKEEFLGTLPVRLVISLLLSLSFYWTGTLIYGMIIHNLIDTLSYAVLLHATKQSTQETKAS